MSVHAKTIEQQILNQEKVRPGGLNAQPKDVQRRILKRVRDKIKAEAGSGADYRSVDWDGSSLHQDLRQHSMGSDEDFDRHLADHELAGKNIWDDFGGGSGGGGPEIGFIPIGSDDDGGGGGQNGGSNPNQLADSDAQDLGAPLEDVGGGTETSPEGSETEPNGSEETGDSDQGEPASEGEPTATPEAGAGEAAAPTEAGLGETAAGAGTAAEAAEGAAVAAEAAEATAAAAETTAVVAEGLAAGWPLLLAIVIAIIAFFCFMFLFQTLAAAFPASTADSNAAGTTQTVICLDPGHVSDNPKGPAGNWGNTGTHSADGTTEVHMNWLMATDVQNLLEGKGYKVVLTKDSETEKVNNIDRVDKCAAAGASLDYRIHMDEPKGIAGPWQEYPGSNYTNVHGDSKSYAETIQKAIVKELGISGHTSGTQPVDGGTKPDITALEGSKEANKKKIPVVLIEMMTMTDANVAWLKGDINGSNKMAKGIANGIENAIPPTTTNGGGSASGKKVAEYALDQVGDSYSQANRCNDFASKPAPDGCDSYDCSGLARWAWYWGSNKKITLPGDTRAMWGKRDDTSLWTKVASISDLQAGDLILWDGHVMIAMDNKSIVAASDPKNGVVHRTLNSGYISYIKSHNYVLLRPVVK